MAANANPQSYHFRQDALTLFHHTNPWFKKALAASVISFCNTIISYIRLGINTGIVTRFLLHVDPEYPTWSWQRPEVQMPYANSPNTSISFCTKKLSVRHFLIQKIKPKPAGVDKHGFDRSVRGDGYRATAEEGVCRGMVMKRCSSFQRSDSTYPDFTRCVNTIT